jgi:hypothetical protein
MKLFRKAISPFLSCKSNPVSRAILSSCCQAAFILKEGRSRLAQALAAAGCRRPAKAARLLLLLATEYAEGRLLRGPR